MADDYKKYLNLKFIGKNNVEYTITSYINQGGNGFVYNCITDENVEYVVKVLHDFGKNNVKYENFTKEIALQEKLNSPYIVKCIDSGCLRAANQKKDRPFYVMKKYKKSLDQMINDNEISPISAYRYSIQLCKALKKMHKRKEPLIHRDLKPENVLYDAELDNVLICDFGLTHIENNGNTINDGFVGNIDYHAPEQKKRGSHEVGTYTDIYSLGLIINVLFTKEIPVGENYKKIWECAPYFQFIDDIVKKMIQHDYLIRERDINSVLLELQGHELEYEVEESFLKPKFAKFGIPLEKIKEIMNLFSLSTYLLKNDYNSFSLNLNYNCDFHFNCSEYMTNSLLLSIMYKKIKRIFEVESKMLEENQIDTLDINNNDDKTLIEAFEKNIDVKAFNEINPLKLIIKRYFMSISNYHAREFINSIPDIKEKIYYNCVDAPILSITNFVKNNIQGYENLLSSNFIELIKYEESDVMNKNVLFFDRNENYIKFANIIKSKISDLSFIIKDDKIKIFFDSYESERQFEFFLNALMENVSSTDVRRKDIDDIISKSEFYNLNNIYDFDMADVTFMLEMLKDNK